MRISEPNFRCLDFHEIMGSMPRIKPEGPWLAGGAVRRAIAGEKLGDFDFFFTDEDQLEDFYCALINHGFVQDRENHNCIQLHKAFHNNRLVAQCIKREFYATPQAVIDSFDLTVCQFAYDGVSIHEGEHSRDHLEQRKLHFHQVREPKSLRYRTNKYLELGFALTRESEEEYNRILAEHPEQSESAESGDETPAETAPEVRIAAGAIRADVIAVRTIRANLPTIDLGAIVDRAAEQYNIARDVMIGGLRRAARVERQVVPEGWQAIDITSATPVGRIQDNPTANDLAENDDTF